MTILVTGSRGGVGRSLLALLRSRGLDVRAASRAPGGLDLPAGVPAVTCDLTDPGTFPTALKDVTSVFLYAEPSHIVPFVEQAAAAGVGHIVLLSTSAVLNPAADDDLIARSHLEVERALAASPIESTFLRPGSFASNALQWSWAIRSTGAVNLPYPDSHTDPIHEADIAEAALAVLTDPRLSGGRYTLTGPESVTFREQIGHIARATGRSVTVNEVSRERWKAEMADYIPADFADALLDWWRSNDGSLAETTRTVEELTGHPARGFALWAEDHAGDFRS
ncbi:NAD(P)H-binding protein [Streptosporangium roseum]|uniref:NmrA family protein n=1 Tax=Streptosporangium roseum (strain ATCC 12428 / DSM 43021 / JCM 3005 / KCTC 9067 / NCIMB 10171 / NRRL 2505 / NI 9100) TaxID=479432 RepID=D2ASN2_STRRD|nr:NAD(P)H-binding protein [Streptosporangium roseum]ACZ88555.1 NmrA family protein [Streptosporangium roseum DSM 43021]